MKNLSLILLILIILIQSIQFELSYAQESVEHQEQDNEAKEHMIILVCGILGGCVCTAALIFTAWFIFRRLKARGIKDNNKNGTEEDNREPDSFMLQIAGADESRNSQINETPKPKRSRDFDFRNNYTQAASPPQPKGNLNIHNIDDNVVRQIKQELLNDLNKQGDANIPIGIPVYDKQKDDSVDFVQQIRQELLRDLEVSNRSRNSEVNAPLGIDKDVVNRLKEEALQDIKNEIKERLRKEMSLSSNNDTYDLT